MAEKMYTEAQVCRMIRDEVFLRTKRLMTHVTRKLHSAPTLTTQQYRPEDDFPSNDPSGIVRRDATTPEHQGNGYGSTGRGVRPGNHPTGVRPRHGEPTHYWTWSKTAPALHSWCLERLRGGDLWQSFVPSEACWRALGISCGRWRWVARAQSHRRPAPCGRGRMVRGPGVVVGGAGRTISPALGGSAFDLSRRRDKLPCLRARGGFRPMFDAMFVPRRRRPREGEPVEETLVAKISADLQAFRPGCARWSPRSSARVRSRSST